MSQAALEYDLGQVERLKKVLATLSRQSLEPMMKSLATEVEEQVRQRFIDSEGPDGPWEDWSERYAERMAGKNRSILIGRGSNGLMGSIRSEHSRERVLVGSHLPHAATHQFGDDARNIPSRPYLGITVENESDLVDIVNDFIDGLFAEAV